MGTALGLFGWIVLLAAGLALAHWQSHRPRMERALLACLPALAVVLADIAQRNLERAVHTMWDAARLMFAFLVRFDRFAPTSLYPPMHDPGPLLPMIYGPMGAYAYLPARLFDATPTSALVAGALLAMAWAFVPAALLLVRKGHRLPGLVAWAVLVIFCSAHPALGYSTMHIHVDAPALGLATLAVVCLRRGATQPWSGLFAILAVGTKQTFLPLLIIMPILAWSRAGWRGALASVGGMAGGAAMLLMALALHGGIANAWFNMIAVPGNHPWIRAFTEPHWRGTFTRQDFGWIAPGDWSGRPRVLLDSARNLLESGLAVFVPLLILLVASRKAFVCSKSWLRGLLHSEFGMLIVVGIALLPASILGPVKVGGAHNTQSPALWFFALAVLVVLRDAVRSDPAREPLRVVTRPALLVTALAGIALLLPFTPDTWPRPGRTDLRDNVHELIFQSITPHHGRWYVPEAPLAVYLATGVLYHFSNGVHERDLAGFRLTETEYLAGLPLHIEGVIFIGDDRLPFEYFGDRLQPVPSPPGFERLRYYRLVLP